ncbi:putative secreted protein (Por secretion system target) [Tenacibaculum lutimaris]|uniref:Putative secreted protein (Por secretion system target) n=1 Tax=Tenacibaculum lutimaris TaxID=285258 RepID=A0A420E0Y1_9FLAO|nr:endonuclease [Tenacibaculum lutimaris]RKF03739.1 putative secreted protein (Por secretion system target) [Tenacibaculum lutimaris]
MKKLLPFFLLITSLSIFAQIPSYYNDVNLSLSGTALKNELATKIINTHTTNLSYTPGVWDALKQTDLDPNDPSKVLLIYGYSDTDGNYVTDRTRDKNANGGTAGTQWNREHVYAKSLGNPNLGTSGPGADAHHLRSADISFNSQRSSKKFADGSGNAGDVASGWYPGDEWKGDVARMMMYMYLRYGSQCLPTGVGTGSTMASDANMLTLFIQWNVDDPVSDFEKQRNPILENLQGNRNPFIDNPAFATEIWGGPQAEDLFGGGSGSDTQAPTAPSNLAASNITETSVSLAWSASTDNTGVTGYDIYQGATKIATVTNTTYNVTGLTAATNYTFSIKAKDAAGNESTASNTVSITTNSTSGGGNGTTTDLLISEYIEGSSNNKAIEIANFTGSSVNLSGYSLKKAANGGGWTNTLILSGQLTTGNVYVIANSSASSTVLNKADKTDTSVLSFNGNDAIGLFKGSTLIDLIGNPNSSSTFAQDVTLQRKSSVTSPNSTYTTSEWNTLAKDTFSGLGNHNIDGGTSTPDTTAPTAPTNVAASNITQTSVYLTWTAATDNIEVTGYDVYQGSTKIASVTTTNFSVSGLTAAANYSFSVKAKDAANNISSSSNTVNVTTLANTISYCSTKGNNVNYEWIDNIVIGGISNATSANGGYGDFTSLTANLPYGNNTIIVSAGFSSSSYTEYWKVWIDFNKNGTFESSEEIVSGSSSSSGNLSYTFSVPTSALSGTTRMRVSMKWNAAPSACETFSYGEVEDYTVNIGASAKGLGDNNITIDGKLENEASIFNASVSPNPTAKTIKIHLGDNRNASFKISTLTGQTVLNGKVTHHTIDLSNLKNGVYILEVNDSQKSFTKKIIKK